MQKISVSSTSFRAKPQRRRNKLFIEGAENFLSQMVFGHPTLDYSTYLKCIGQTGSSVRLFSNIIKHKHNTDAVFGPNSWPYFSLYIWTFYINLKFFLWKRRRVLQQGVLYIRGRRSFICRHRGPTKTNGASFDVLYQ